MKQLIKTTNILLTLIFFALLVVISIKDMSNPNYEFGMMLFWLLLGLVSPAAWFFGLFWIPFVAKRIVDSPFKNLSTILASTAPYAVLVAHLMLIAMVCAAISS
jgi:hypothetical protein